MHEVGRGGLPVHLTRFDIETVRVAHELTYARIVELHPIFGPLASRLVSTDSKELRRNLMANSLRLSESMAPEAHRIALEAQRILGITGEIELYQRSGAENAAIHFSNDPILLEIHGAILPKLDAVALLGLFGHELGHFLAHGPTSRVRAARSLLPAIGRIDDQALEFALSRLSMMSELTADRVGLLACQDLEAMLRLEMVALTGLASAELTWDTSAYLGQCRDVIEQGLAEGDNVQGTTHPEHNLRAYALWLFSETRIYRELTGRGPGTRELADVDAVIARCFGSQPIEESSLSLDYSQLGEPPRELHECALAASVLVAYADGRLADEEREAIEHNFAAHVPDWQSYLDLEIAAERFRETAAILSTAGSDLARRLFLVLVRVMAADGEVHPDELGMIVSIGRVLGVEREYRQGLASVLRTIGAVLPIEEVAPVELPLPARRQDVEDAFRTFIQGVLRRGESTITLRRLLRIHGTEQRSDERVADITSAFQAHGIKSSALLGDVGLDERIALTAPKLTVERKPDVLPSTQQGLIVALRRLREQLVSGDGRSPAVRLRHPRRGRAFDLVELEKVSVGMAERVLAQVRERRVVRAIDAADAGRHGPAGSVASELLALARETAQRAEETGAHVLYVGHPFVTGNVAGYAVRAPLILFPVELERDGDGARGYKLRPRKDETAIANQSLIRLIFNKRGFVFTDELSDELETLAGAEDGGAEAVRKKLAEVGLATADAPTALQAFRDRDAELVERSDFLEIEEVAVLGLFPQSSSDLLQDYDGLIHDLAAPAADLGTHLAAATALLPGRMAAQHAATQHAGVQADWVPVIPADPSQRRVVVEARRQGAMVVDGPPGTGKSQVIANLVAEALRRGERVAVVCEKRAALDVVRQRLGSIGFAKAIGVVHDITEDRKPLFAHIAARLEQRERIPFDAAEAERQRVEHVQIEQALQARMNLLGLRPTELDMSVGELFTFVSAHPTEFDDSARALSAVPQARLRELMDLVEALHPLADLWSAQSVWPLVANGRRRLTLDAQRTDVFAALERALVDAIAAARELERLELESPVPVAAIERARDELACAVRSRTLRGDHRDRELFSAVLQIATRTPDQIKLLGDARDVWQQASASLVRVERPIRFELEPPSLTSLATLRRLAGSWYRGFVIAWWRAKGAVRRELGRLWPERAADPVSSTLLSDIDDRLVASKAWHALRETFDRIGLSRFLPERAKELADVIARITQLADGMHELASARTPLDAAQAWLGADGHDALSRWDEAVDARLRVLAARDQLARAATAVVEAFPWVPALPRASELVGLLERWRKDAQRLAEADALRARVVEMFPDGLGVLLALHRAMPGATPNDWRLHIQRMWAIGWLARLEREQPQLAQLGAGADDREVSRLVERLRVLETERRYLEIERVLARVDETELMSVEAAGKGQRRTPQQRVREDMLSQVRKQRMQMPLRTFVRKFAPQGLLDVVPVWLLSPETMAILFPRQPLFDLIVFDEASQCTVEAGLPVLLRAKRVVIAGDEKQMPPSSYFALGSSDEQEPTAQPDEDDDTRDAVRDLLSAESLLSLARPRVHRASLDWHYRCKDESLIAFSNHAMYQGELLTVPATAGAMAPSAIHWVPVANGSYDGGENKPEAERVVDVVDELLGRDAKQTIGVVTFNLRQRKAVLDAIDARKATDPEFRERFANANEARPVDERLFVKNLEQVQGDERDAIIFSLGHAPKERMRGGVATGEQYVPARFGPLGQRGGERRLNVAISRAKSSCYIVASFSPSQLSVASARNDGPRLFKQFLEFSHHLHHERRLEAKRVLDLVRAARRASSMTRARSSLEGSVPLETQIELALEAAGIPYEPRVGESEFRIPIAVLDPTDPTRYALALLLDEAGASTSAFEAHVHRPAVLAQRGWRVLTVTSATWRRRANDVLDEIVRLVPNVRGAVSNPIYTQHREQRRRALAPTGITMPTVTAVPAKLPELRTGPVLITPEGVPAWALAIDDALFRKALLHLHKHGTMNESELTTIVGGPRRARVFAGALEGWKSALPFAVEVSSGDGVETYRVAAAATN